MTNKTKSEQLKEKSVAFALGYVGFYSYFCGSFIVFFHLSLLVFHFPQPFSTIRMDTRIIVNYQWLIVNYRVCSVGRFSNAFSLC